jgi:hypothetical protein
MVTAACVKEMNGKKKGNRSERRKKYRRVQECMDERVDGEWIENRKIQRDGYVGG